MNSSVNNNTLKMKGLKWREKFRHHEERLREARQITRRD
jgi:hypothetical protein